MSAPKGRTLAEQIAEAVAGVMIDPEWRAFEGDVETVKRAVPIIAAELKPVEDVLDNVETSLVAIAAHSIQVAMATDARELLVEVREALAILRGGR